MFEFDEDRCGGGVWSMYIYSSGIPFSIFSLFALKNSVGVAQDACCVIVLCKVLLGTIICFSRIL